LVLEFLVAKFINFVITKLVDFSLEL
jgi:hypothetical protein